MIADEFMAEDMTLRALREARHLTQVQSTIKQRMPNLRKGRGWVADDFWLGETT